MVQNSIIIFETRKIPGQRIFCCPGIRLRIRHSFPALIIGAFQVFGLFENIDLRDKFLRGQFVIVNAKSRQKQTGFLLFLGALVVQGGLHLLLNFDNRRSGVCSSGVLPVGFPDIM